MMFVLVLTGGAVGAAVLFEWIGAWRAGMLCALATIILSLAGSPWAFVTGAAGYFYWSRAIIESLKPHYG